MRAIIYVWILTFAKCKKLFALPCYSDLKTKCHIQQAGFLRKYRASKDYKSDILFYYYYSSTEDS